MGGLRGQRQLLQEPCECSNPSLTAFSLSGCRARGMSARARNACFVAYVITWSLPVFTALSSISFPFSVGENLQGCTGAGL